jgi:hypothetical protein
VRALQLIQDEGEALAVEQADDAVRRGGRRAVDSVGDRAGDGYRA